METTMLKPEAVMPEVPEKPEEEAYEIPAENLAELKSKIDRLNRRAKKLGAPAVSYDVGAPFPKKVQVCIRTEEFPQGKLVEVEQVHYPFTVRGVSPKFQGWVLVGVLERVGKENVLRAAPGQSIPQQYRGVESKCDHCRTKRHRKETFIVHHEKEGYKQVGRQCIADFLGHPDPHRYAQWAQWVSRIDEHVRSFSEFGGSVQEVWVETYLSYVAAIIRTHGWLSMSKARSLNEEYPGRYTGTASLAWSEMLSREKRKLEPTEEDKKLAKEAFRWAREVLPDKYAMSNYEHNLKVSCSADTMSYSLSAIIASLIPAYQRVMEREIKYRLQRKKEEKSEWVGEERERREFTLTVLRVFELESDWGVTSLHKMVDADGNIFVWYASNECLEQGKTFKLRGTIKRHDDYKGIKQTVLTRCVVLLGVIPENGGEDGEEETS